MCKGMYSPFEVANVTSFIVDMADSNISGSADLIPLILVFPTLECWLD